MKPTPRGESYGAVADLGPTGELAELSYYRVADRGPGFRLPAYVRRSDDAESSRRPHLGGGVIAVLTDAAITCPMVYMVCPPGFAAHLWDLSFLRGTKVAVLYFAAHKQYAQQLAVELVRAGCVGPTLSAVLEEVV